MKLRLLTIVLILLCSKINGQFAIQENATNYIGAFSYLMENSKLENGYFYNVVLNDSIRIGDTSFVNSSGKTKTVMIYANKKNNILWFLSLDGGHYEETFKVGNKILQYIQFQDTEYAVDNYKISNPDSNKCWGILMIDTNGQNLRFIHGGHQNKNAAVSFLSLNCLSTNNSDNVIISGYQKGETSIGDLNYSTDTFLSTYFIAEMTDAGNIISYQPLFKADYPYFYSRGAEYSGKLIFESSFDSLIIDNKFFSVLKYQNFTINDLVLIVLDKNNLDISNYAVLQDSSSNTPTSTGKPLTVNAYGVLWPINSGTKSLKVKDSFILVPEVHQKVSLILSIGSMEVIQSITIDAENEGSNDVGLFDDSSMILTYRNPGSYIYINDLKINIPGINTTAFVVFIPSTNPKLIFNVDGNNYGVRLTSFSEQHLELWGNYIGSNSNIEVKSQTLLRNSNFNHWPTQSSHYSMDEFSMVEITKIPSFVIYPNPGSDIIQLQINQSNLDYKEIKIYDSLGKLIFKTFELNSPISITNLHSGQYFMELYGSDNSVITQKFIVR